MRLPAPVQVVQPLPVSFGRRRALASGLLSLAAGGLPALAGAQGRMPPQQPQAPTQTQPQPTAIPTSLSPVPQADWRLTAAAQLMAGIVPAAGDPVIDRFVSLDAFKAHQEWMREQWAPVRARLLAMEGWREQNIRIPDARNRTMLYPFSGPDFLNAYALFPNHARYVFFSLERPSELPDLATRSAQEFAELLASVREALRDIFERNYFITSYMSRQLTAPRLRGTVPVIAVMMALYNRQIVSAEPLDLFPELTTAYADPASKRPRMPLRGMRIVFMDPATRTTQSLQYFSLDATDRALVFYPEFTAWLSRQGPATALVKSASYLLHDKQFLQVREALLSTADTLVQDDTGVPYRVLRQAGWDVQLFGEYRKPIPPMGYGYQRDLQESFIKNGNPARLPFPFGYHWREGGAGSGMLIATRPLTSAGAQATIVR